MPVELSISALPEMSTLIYFRNDDPGVLVELAQAWIDDNLACRLPPLRTGETPAARAEDIAAFHDSLRRRLLVDGPVVGPVTGAGTSAVINEQLAVGVDVHRDTQTERGPASMTMGEGDTVRPTRWLLYLWADAHVGAAGRGHQRSSRDPRRASSPPLSLRHDGGHCNPSAR